MTATNAMCRPARSGRLLLLLFAGLSGGIAVTALQGTAAEFPPRQFDFPVRYAAPAARGPQPPSSSQADGEFVRQMRQRQERLRAQGFVPQVFREGDTEHRYIVYLPPGYTPQRKWPVLLYLHGASERGTDGYKPLDNGLAPMIRARPQGIPFIAVFPQSEDTSSRILQGWKAGTPNARRALAILDDVGQRYSIDPERVILTGWSMGGHGVWSIAAAHPERFAALVPVAAGGDPAAVEPLAEIPVWAFHGRLDRAVPVKAGRQMVQAHQDAGGVSRFTEIRSEGHAVWRYAYGTKEVLEWMQNPRRQSPQQVRLPESERVPLKPVVDPVFRPAIEMPGAVTLHLGQQALATASSAIPGMIPAEFLRGEINSVTEFATIQKRQVSLRFAEITWAGSLSRVVVTAGAGNRLKIQLGIRDARLRIGTAFVAGGGQTATAGPIDVEIGRGSPVWLTVEVSPSVVDRQIRFRVLDASIALTQDNFRIRPPQQVKVHGGLITPQQVSSALVRGLQQRRNQFASQIREYVPRLVTKLEEKLQIPGLAEAARTVWPIPVYRPLLRSWPDDILVDEHGVTIVCGLTAASLDPARGPQTPALLERLSPPIAKLHRGDHLEIGLAPGVLAPMSQLLIAAGIDRIHVGDIPGFPLREFLDPAALSAAIPSLADLPAETELWSELQLTGVPAMTVDGIGENSDTSAAKSGQPAAALLEATAPGVAIHTRFRLPGDTQWTPLGTFRFELRRKLQTSVLRPGFGSRQLKLQWAAPLDIHAHAEMAAESETVHMEQLQELFHRGLQRWIGDKPFTALAVPPLKLGDSRLSLASVSWHEPLFLLNFEPPGIRIVNQSDVTLRYETRSPTGQEWTGPYVLQPRGFHEFPVGTPLIYRRSGVRVSPEWTLSAGTRYEFRSYGDAPPALYQTPEPTVVTPSGAAE